MKPPETVVRGARYPGGYPPTTRETWETRGDTRRRFFFLFSHCPGATRGPRTFKMFGCVPPLSLKYDAPVSLKS